MVRRVLPRDRASWAGLGAAAPAPGSSARSCNYALTPWICASKVNLVPVAAHCRSPPWRLPVPFVSWRAWRAAAAQEAELGAAVMEAPRPFLAGVSILLAVLFALVILTQGAAALVLNGCER